MSPQRLGRLPAESEISERVAENRQAFRDFLGAIVVAAAWFSDGPTAAGVTGFLDADTLIGAGGGGRTAI
jgi:hypothetical protein